MRLYVATMLCLLLSFGFGCSRKVIIQEYISNEELAFSEQYLNLFRERNFEEILRPIDPNILTDETHLQLVQIAQRFPADEPMEAEVVDWEVTYEDNGNKGIEIVYQYKLSSSWLLATLTYESSKDGDFIVNGIHIHPIQNSLAETYKFDFFHTSAINYLFISIFVFVPIFIIVTFICCLRTPIRKGKWLWAIFVLIGLGKISMNLHSGSVDINPLNVNVLLAIILSPTKYGPRILIMTIPLGAIVFWIRRTALIAKPDYKDTRLATGAESQDNAGPNK